MNWLSRRRDRHRAALLSYLRSCQPPWTTALAMCEAAGMTAGTIYPLLVRWENECVLVSRWDVVRRYGEPRRRLYALASRVSRVGEEEAGT